ncbi:helix-turn-helix transcriptional regulator [Amycolatopsis pigmentata]|uniref:LuxR C-terminal-related transcriptional regulator n=1 Tax=Amycolatopsis pigmentata TaxID=450801 RepID=A0ABW5FNI1_9PSEU
MRDPSTPHLPLPRAVLEHDYGRLLLSAGYRTDARVWLAQSHRRFTVLGARPFPRRAEQALRLCGRAMPKPVTGGPGLAEREEQVSRLVAHGLTNREIANELYITTKTVEYHLSNVYAKLGVASRQELKRLLAPRQPSRRAGAPRIFDCIGRRNAGLECDGKASAARRARVP